MFDQSSPRPVVGRCSRLRSRTGSFSYVVKYEYFTFLPCCLFRPILSFGETFALIVRSRRSVYVCKLLFSITFIIKRTSIYKMCQQHNITWYHNMWLVKKKKKKSPVLQFAERGTIQIELNKKCIHHITTDTILSTISYPCRPCLHSRSSKINYWSIVDAVTSRSAV